MDIVTSKIYIEMYSEKQFLNALFIFVVNSSSDTLIGKEFE